MYYFYGKSNRGHGICPLYRGCPPLGESVIRGFTVHRVQPCQTTPLLEFHVPSVPRVRNVKIFIRLGQ